MEFTRMPSGRRVTNMRRAGHLARAERHAHKGLVRQVRQVKQDARRDMRCGCRHVGQRLGCGLAWSIAVAARWHARQIEEAAGLEAKCRRERVCELCLVQRTPRPVGER